MLTVIKFPSGRRSVGIVRSRTKSHGVYFFVITFHFFRKTLLYVNYPNIFHFKHVNIYSLQQCKEKQMIINGSATLEFVY
jgi:hypothetical protein